MRYVCELPGCDRPVMNDGRSKLCAAHYQRKRRGVENWQELIANKCEECDTPINTRPRHHGGRHSKLCSECRAERDRQIQIQRNQRRRHKAQEASHAAGQAP